MKKYLIIGSIVLVVFIVGYIFFRMKFPSQSQKLSRLTGATLNLKVPKDLKKLIDVDFVVQKDGTTSKYLTYINNEGEIISQELTDHGIFQAKIKWKGISESQIAK